MKNKTSEIKIEKKGEIYEVKYNIFLALNNKCKPTKDEFIDFLNERYLKAKRLVIQDIEISEGIIKYGPKSYAFIPLKNSEIFEIEKKEKITIEKKNNRLIMSINETPLINEEKFNEIINPNDNKKENNSLKNSQIFSNRNSSNNESLDSSKSKKSKKDNSSEKDGIIGEKFYKKNEENKYTRYIFCSLL